MSSNREILGAGKWLRLVKEGKWEWVERANTTGVVGLYAFTQQEEVVLIEQPRAPLESKSVLEIPAGLVGDIVGQEDEAMELAAHREMEEETGYKIGSLTEIVEVPSSPGMTNETIILYVASDLSKVGLGGGDESEDITVLLVPMTDFQSYIESRISQGDCVDAKVLAVPFFWNMHQRTQT